MFAFLLPCDVTETRCRVSGLQEMGQTLPVVLLKKWFKKTSIFKKGYNTDENNTQNSTVYSFF